MPKFISIFLWLNVLVMPAFIVPAYSQEEPPSSQTSGGLIRREKDLEEKRKLEKRIRKPKLKPRQIISQEVAIGEAGRLVFIKKITVEGVTLLSPKVIKKITAQFEGRELSLEDMQKVADLITKEYRKKGYITSSAYVPAQTIKEGVLVIGVIEGKLGQIEIKGNRYVRTASLMKKIKIEPKGYFDYSALQKSLIYINEHPDRIARAILVAGKEPGTTDIVIIVEDRFPVHLGVEYDNVGSKYIDKDRAALIIEHNNLLGYDDRLNFKLQQAEADLYKFKSATYVFPVNETFDVGAYYFHSKLKLAREFQDVDARGKATIVGLFLNKTLVAQEKFNLRLNSGFDYKHIKNYLLGAQSSKDELRVFKAGFDLDINDLCGTSIIVSELNVGMPRMFGALASKDGSSSRAGAGGKFFKGVFNFFRMQPMPFSSTLLFKNSAQYTNYALVAAEEFQLGGAASVRGYPPGEHTGDKGIFSSVEWSFPSYFVPKDLNIPLTKDNLFKAMRFVVFYDWATAHLNKLLAGEEKHQTLKGWGFGARFNFRDHIFVRLEFGYPIGKKPSDDEHLHPWVHVNWKF
ncbi:MAG: ShlB/FhaC/HecB family hemolysin secretion/activation protein [Candidatus Omnitrophota bacterium]|nr:MAG: ShlB/FhaC/HecB family hemolysin secretion/activation protein [Candidatus Omnitrophota bacterium]